MAGYKEAESDVSPFRCAFMLERNLFFDLVFLNLNYVNVFSSGFQLV